MRVQSPPAVRKHRLPDGPHGPLSGRTRAANLRLSLMTSHRTDAFGDLPTDTVPFVALEREHALIAGELHAAFDRVVRGNAFVLGEEVERFEDAWASACGTGHCVGTASGTAALTIL